MGWPGIVFLGLVVGLAAGWLHPLRRLVSRPFGRLWAAGLAGIVAAMIAKMLGNITGAFHDGESLEWLACVLFALVAGTVTVGLAARR